MSSEVGLREVIDRSLYLEVLVQRDRQTTLANERAARIAELEADLAEANAQREILSRANTGLASGWEGVDGLCVRNPAPHAAHPAEPRMRTVTLSRARASGIPVKGGGGDVG